MKQAPPMFRRAIELDPEYAQAYAGLADSLCELMLWRMVQPDSGALEEAKSRRAPRARTGPGPRRGARRQGPRADDLPATTTRATEAFEHALKLDPELYVAYYFYARHCFTQGNYARAVDLFDAAHRAQPDEFQALALAVNAADAGGRRTSASRSSRSKAWPARATRRRSIRRTHARTT